MNKSDIVEHMADELGSSKAEARRLLDAHIEAIAHHLAIGNRVVIRGLGTFATREVPGHRGRRPTDGQTLEVPATRQVTFRTAEGLRTVLRTQGAPA